MDALYDTGDQAARENEDDGVMMEGGSEAGAPPDAATLAATLQGRALGRRDVAPTPGDDDAPSSAEAPATIVSARARGSAEAGMVQPAELPGDAASPAASASPSPSSSPSNSASMGKLIQQSGATSLGRTIGRVAVLEPGVIADIAYDG